jgi:HlyD family secretion protein
VLPEIKNGTLPFEITFTNPSNLALRPQQRVTVFLITSKRENTLRVRRSAALAGKGTRTVFVQRDNKAVRTQVQIGVTGAQFTEILSGLKEGDLLFLNDLSEFNHLSEITLR